jgi:hypothetical protein
MDEGLMVGSESTFMLYLTLFMLKLEDFYVNTMHQELLMSILLSWYLQ